MTAENDLEIRGQTVEEAIEAGLSQLGLDRSDVIIDVIDEGSKGILGIGVREAVVRLVPMGGGAKPAPAIPTPATETAVASQPASKPSKIDNKERTRQPVSVPSTEEVAEERDVALEIVETILQQMQIEAKVKVDLSEPDDLTGRQINEFQITGNDLGVLIGPRGETLNSLQFITRLMVGHRLQRRADFVIDIEGYRERRRLALNRLAERMANKVMKQGRPVTLEPMPPQDRRIIHMTLRNSEDVFTQSTGEGNRRRVRILPK
jgi:spoIIIJ-associated protein